MSLSARHAHRPVPRARLQPMTSASRANLRWCAPPMAAALATVASTSIAMAWARAKRVIVPAYYVKDLGRIIAVCA